MINQDIAGMSERALLTAKNDTKGKLKSVQARLKIDPYNKTNIQQFQSFAERLDRINDQMRQRFRTAVAQQL